MTNLNNLSSSNFCFTHDQLHVVERQAVVHLTLTSAGKTGCHMAPWCPEHRLSSTPRIWHADAVAMCRLDSIACLLAYAVQAVLGT